MKDKAKYFLNEETSEESSNSSKEPKKKTGDTAAETDISNESANESTQKGDKPRSKGTSEENKKVKKTSSGKAKHTSKGSPEKKGTGSKKKVVKVRRKARRKTNYMPYIVGAVILVILLAIMMNLDRFKGDGSIGDDSVVATVNGEPVYLSKINQQYDILPANVQAMVSKELILNKTIDEIILVQEAEKEGITVDSSEVDEVIQMLMLQNGITEEQLIEQLETNNMSMEELRAVYLQQLIITKLVNATVLSQIVVSDEEIETYFNENQDNPIIKTNKMVRARHILVENKTDAEAVLIRLENGEGFAEVAQEVSLDTGSAVNGGDLGYFEEGQMVQPFNDAAFSMSLDDEPRIVESQFGFHIIEVTGIKDARNKTLEEVKDLIAQTIRAEQQNEYFTQYLDEVRENAEIIINWEILGRKSAGDVPLGSDTQLPVEENEESPDTSGSEPSGEISTFQKTGEPICTEDGKPIVRVFSTTTCPHCSWVKDTVDSVLKEYGDSIVAYHWEVDIGDNTLTDVVETDVPDAEMEAFLEANQAGFVPFYLFGCAYSRVGNGYERENDLASEAAEFRAVIDSLLGEDNAPVEVTIR